MNMLEVKNLTKDYGGFRAVKGVDFFIKKGEIFGFLGPNGAGKTTTINMLTGLARPTSGSINLAGEDGVKNIKKIQQIIGIVPDESNLYDEMNGFENLIFCAALYGMEKNKREKRAKELLEQFGLADTGKKPFKAYSKGMKRKLTITAGIIHEPQILFLDEPTTGIDAVESARQIRKLILSLNEKGTTIFLTTHYIEEAERLCHRVGFIVDGRIVRLGALDELMQETQNENTVQFTLQGGVLNVKDALKSQFSDYTVSVLGDTVVKIQSPSKVNLIPFMKFFEENNMMVHEAKIVRPSLEEVFVKVTGIELEKMKKEKEGGRK
ncbi:MAG: ABC transporter ATP-binding protein [Bacillota bacterium]|nr:ABC transporter ATP-binding protein [Bacillota bacterium]